MKVAVIGGGAAGFFSAIHAKINHPNADVYILEKTSKLLSKVRISGGGRCNVTTSIQDIKTLSACYPRGKNYLKKAFNEFNSKDTWTWFQERGVKLKIEKDGRVFPISNTSQSIIDCLMSEVHTLGIQIKLKAHVNSLSTEDGKISLSYKGGDKASLFDKVIVTTGGSPKLDGFNWLKKSGHVIEPPVPSLFTLNMPHESITKLMGISIDHAVVAIQGTKLRTEGPVLITHWGMSGPAILRISAEGARILSDMNYHCTLLINWINKRNTEEIFSELKYLLTTSSHKPIERLKAFGIPTRLWQYLLNKININTDRKCGELGKKSIHKLIGVLTNDRYSVKGKTTFKEEFVTCGGISLKKSVNIKTMESKALPNVYFAGEVLNIDGITGGFNFQAAWTTGFIAGKLL